MNIKLLIELRHHQIKLADYLYLIISSSDDSKHSLKPGIEDYRQNIVLSLEDYGQNIVFSLSLFFLHSIFKALSKVGKIVRCQAVLRRNWETFDPCFVHFHVFSIICLDYKNLRF